MKIPEPNYTYLTALWDKQNSTMKVANIWNFQFLSNKYILGHVKSENTNCAEIATQFTIEKKMVQTFMLNPISNKPTQQKKALWW